MSLLKTINDLGIDKTRLLYSETVDGELLTVRQYKSWRWLSAGGEMMQSLMDTEQPQELLLPNLNAMMTVFDFIKNPSSVLNLGAGAGCIERFLAGYQSGLSVTSVECSRKIIELAGKFFDMDTSTVIFDTAEHYLENNDNKYDVIFVDLYSAERQPVCLYEEKFHHFLSKAMKPTCAVAFNLLPESEEDLLGILKPLNEHVHWLLLHEVPEHDNVVIIAFNDNNYSMKSMLSTLRISENNGYQWQVIAQNT